MTRMRTNIWNLGSNSAKIVTENEICNAVSLLSMNTPGISSKATYIVKIQYLLTYAYTHVYIVTYAIYICKNIYTLLQEAHLLLIVSHALQVVGNGRFEVERFLAIKPCHLLAYRFGHFVEICFVICKSLLQLETTTNSNVQHGYSCDAVSYWNFHKICGTGWKQQRFQSLSDPTKTRVLKKCWTWGQMLFIRAAKAAPLSIDMVLNARYHTNYLGQTLTSSQILISTK